jgi:hypothetical protein
MSSIMLILVYLSHLIGLETEGLELDLAVLLVHRVAVEVHVAGHVKVDSEKQAEATL